MKTAALVVDYLQGCKVFLDYSGTRHLSDETVRAAVIDAIGQVEFVFPQGKEEAKYTKKLETCVEKSVIFDAAFVNQPQGVILTFNRLSPSPQP